MGWLLDNAGELVLDGLGEPIWIGERPADAVGYEAPTGLQVIADNLLTSVVADSENAAYPDDNVIDEHPKKLWKAANGVLHSVLSCQFTGGCNAVAIFNTNASSITININDPNEIHWPDFELDTWVDVIWVYLDIAASIDIQQTGDSYSLWASFEYVSVPLNMEIIFDASTTVQAGVVVVGEALGFKNPDFGLQQGLRDYSILKELSNGAFYHKQRDVVRTFSGQMVLERSSAEDGFYAFMHTVARTNSYTPMAWRVTDLDDFEWVVYARFTTPPQGYHTYPTHSPVTFSLTEVL